MATRNKKFGERLKALRLEHGCTQAELAAEICRHTDNPSFCEPSSVSKWESGIVPRPATATALAEVLNVSVRFLLSAGDGESTEFKSLSSTEYGEYAQITVSDLYRYDGLPVWIESDADCRVGRYALVNADDEKLIFHDGSGTAFSEIQGTIKAGPSAFSVSMQNVSGKALALEKIRDGQSVWVEFLKAPSYVRDSYRGYYVYEKELHTFRSESGMLLPASQYGVRFIALDKGI